MMKQRFRPWAWLMAACTFFGASAAPAAAGAPPHSREVIFEWNELAVSYPGATLGAFRQQAMVHIAMFDAINSIERRYEPWQVRVDATPLASSEAAAAQAAHDVMLALFPGGKAAFDAKLDDRLARIPPFLRASGVAAGRKAAQAILQWRTADGAEKPNIAWTPPALPGLWQPDSAAPTQVAAFVHMAGIKPFGLLTPTQYLPVPPPLLNSAAYLEAFNEVRDMGSAASTLRSPEQTQFSRMIHGGAIWSPSPFGLWSQVARKASESKRLSLIETARVFAMLTAAMNDGLQTSHVSKYVYAFWRPVTAIRGADNDGNGSTAADPTWTPLLSPTPAYPSHASNLTCIGMSAARALARLLDNDSVPFTVDWVGTGTNAGAQAARSFTSFSSLAQQAGMSRVHGGIHFRFEIDAALDSCTKVADYLADNYLQPDRGEGWRRAPRWRHIDRD